MDEIALIRALAPAGAKRQAAARAAAWQALEARIDTASTSSRAIPARTRRRGVLTLAGAGAVAAVVAGILVLSSGPSAEPAAAEALHETAAVAASGEGAPALEAGPGQYYFTMTKELELKGWYPGSYEIPGAPASRPGGFSALIPSENEWWLSPEGGNRTRTTLGTPRFLSSAERVRWEAAGSPFPSNFEPARQEELRRLGGESGERVLELARGVVDIERPKPNGETSPELFYPDLSGDPTDPAELRLGIQNHQAPGISDEPGKPLGATETIEDLTGVLHHPNASPALRAAAFNALAEMPGVGLNRNATDLVGRSGYAISYERPQVGERDEYIFDPETSRFLGERTVLVDPTQDPVVWKGYEAGLITRQVAYLQSKVVDSTREPAE
jgi:hypothetical protein